MSVLILVHLQIQTALKVMFLDYFGSAEIFKFLKYRPTA